MARSLRLHPNVVADLKQATEWYDDISFALGNRFRKEVNSRLDNIQSHPELFGRVHGDMRAARVHGFPYLIVFELETDIISIRGVVHASSDPAKWQRRGG